MLILLNQGHNLETWWLSCWHCCHGGGGGGGGRGGGVRVFADYF